MRFTASANVAAPLRSRKPHSRARPLGPQRLRLADSGDVNFRETDGEDAGHAPRSFWWSVGNRTRRINLRELRKRRSDDGECTRDNAKRPADTRDVLTASTRLSRLPSAHGVVLERRFRPRGSSRHHLPDYRCKALVPWRRFAEEVRSQGSLSKDSGPNVTAA